MKKHDTPGWAARGSLIWFGHFHEPPIFLKRKGDWHQTMQEFYKESHSDRYIKKLAQLGCNNINTHFYKGFALSFEEEHQKILHKLIKTCHKYKIKVNAYVQSGNIFYESLLQEVPEAADWARKNIHGLPQTFGLQEYRWRPCPSKGGWVEYLKKCCTAAIKDFHFDGIFFDNYTAIGCNDHKHIAGETCYCEDCQNAFRQYLAGKYRDAKEAFGIPSFRHVRIPGHLENGQDPLVREWFYFKDEVMAKVLKQLYEHIKSLKKDAVVATNSTIVPTGNPLELAPYNDVAFWEDYAFSRWEDGCLINLVLPLKAATAAGITLVKLGYYHKAMAEEGVFWSPVEDFRLQIAEAFTFDAHSPQTPWMHKMPEHTFKSTKQYLDFFKRRKKIYDRPATAAPVCLLYPYRLFIRSFDEHWASFHGMIQILLQNRIPFDIIFPEQLEDRLKRYDVLVLSDYQALSDKEAALIKRFVRKGGGLFASGRCSLYDERFMRRKNYALADVFKVSYEDVVRTGVKNNGIVKYGKGRAAFVPEVIERVEFLTEDGARPIEDPENVCWPLKIKCRLPERHGEVASAIKKLPGRGMPVEVIASETVVCNLNRQKKMLAVHLLNYDIETPQQDILIKINASRYRVRAVYGHFPERKAGEKPARLQHEKKEGFYAVSLPELNIYCCLEVRLTS